MYRGGVKNGKKLVLAILSSMLALAMIMAGCKPISSGSSVGGSSVGGSGGDQSGSGGALFSVTYDKNESAIKNGSAIQSWTDVVDSNEYSEGDEVTVADLPTGLKADGYEITDWVDESGTQWAPGSEMAISKDTVLKANWVAKTGVVNLKTDDGVIAGGLNVIDGGYSIGYTTGDKTEFPKPTKDGYTFAGWQKGSDTFNELTGKEYGETIDVTAKWTAIAYNITYKVAGAGIAASELTFETGKTLPATYTIESDEITLPTPTNNISDKKLGNWTPSNKIAKGSTGDKEFTFDFIDANATSVALSIPNADKVNGDVNAITQSITQIKDGDPAKDLPAVTAKPGYKFEGWFDAETYGTKQTQVTYQATEIKLYGRITPIKYKIAFNDGTSTEEKDATYDVAMHNAKTKANYNFGGWSLTQGGAALPEIKNLTTNENETVTLYALWTWQHLDKVVQLNVQTGIQTATKLGGVTVGKDSALANSTYATMPEVTEATEGASVNLTLVAPGTVNLTVKANVPYLPGTPAGGVNPKGAKKGSTAFYTNYEVPLTVNDDGTVTPTYPEFIRRRYYFQDWQIYTMQAVYGLVNKYWGNGPSFTPTGFLSNPGAGNDSNFGGHGSLTTEKAGETTGSITHDGKTLKVKFTIDANGALSLAYDADSMNTLALTENFIANANTNSGFAGGSITKVEIVGNPNYASPVLPQPGNYFTAEKNGNDKIDFKAKVLVNATPVKVTTANGEFTVKVTATTSGITVAYPPAPVTLNIKEEAKKNSQEDLQNIKSVSVEPANSGLTVEKSGDGSIKIGATDADDHSIEVTVTDTSDKQYTFEVYAVDGRFEYWYPPKGGKQDCDLVQKLEKREPVLLVASYGYPNTGGTFWADQRTDRIRDPKYWEGGNSPLNVWAMVPQELKNSGNVLLTVHPNLTFGSGGNFNMAGQKAWIDEMLTMCDQEKIPVIIVMQSAWTWYYAFNTIYPGSEHQSWIDSMVAKHPMLMGFNATEEHHEDRNTVAYRLQVWLEYCAKKGKVFMLFDSNTHFPHYPKHEGFRNALIKYGKKYFMYGWKDTLKGGWPLCYSEGVGMWMSDYSAAYGGLIDTWTWNMRGWKEVFAGTTGSYGDNWPQTIPYPEGLMAIYMMNMYMNGATVYNFELPFHVYGNSRNPQDNWAPHTAEMFANSIVPFFKWAKEHPAPTKQEMTEYVKFVNKGNWNQNAYPANMLNTRDRNNWGETETYLTGRYGVVPYMPNELPIQGALTDIQTYSGSKSQNEWNTAFPQQSLALDAGKTEGFVAKRWHAGVNGAADKPTWFLYNYTVNKTVSGGANNVANADTEFVQYAKIPLNSDKSKTLEVKMTPHTGVIVQQTGDNELKVWMTNMRIQKDNIFQSGAWSGKGLQESFYYVISQMCVDGSNTNARVQEGRKNTARDTVFTFGGVSSVDCSNLNTTAYAGYPQTHTKTAQTGQITSVPKADAQQAAGKPSAKVEGSVLTVSGNGWCEFTVTF